MKKSRDDTSEVNGVVEFGGMSLLCAGEGNVHMKRETRKHV